ncbi:hypothetical protein [Ancylobacter terrae]|uniref:hypothetical protein n=1 Tax=Ancylobacter sp. sgz301288 TaxID=3342077 RepID=UPI00385A9E9A
MLRKLLLSIGLLGILGTALALAPVSSGSVIAKAPSDAVPVVHQMSVSAVASSTNG